MLGQQFSIIPITEIPYNPQGYDIVEQVHGTLKQYLHKTKNGGIIPEYFTQLFKSSSFHFKFLKFGCQGTL